MDWEQRKETAPTVSVLSMALNLFQGGRMGVRIVLLLSTKLYVHLAKDEKVHHL